MKLIVGLGNPGRSYTHNRHNIGFMCISHFARAQGIQFDKKIGQARIGTGEVAGDKVVLARPQTYMNLSGQSVSQLTKRFKIAINDLLVIHDDLDLPLGKIRIRKGVGWTGHKGVRSVRDELGSGDFLLLRVGIGRPSVFESPAGDKESEVIDYVLSDFAAEEKETIAHVITEVGEAITCLLTESLTSAMNKYN
ncbi:aminoacyl-tRNA hydrolase [Chloroflexota bacterium]